MTTILILLAVSALLVSRFGPFAAFALSAGVGAASGLYGASKSSAYASNARHARERAIARQVKYWKQAYARSKGMFEGRRQDILGQAESLFGGVTARTAQSGFGGTTVQDNLSRGAMFDVNRQLTDLASEEAATEYGKWIDLASIKGQSKWEGAGSIPNYGGMYGQMGADVGGALGMMGMWKSGWFGGMEDKE